MSSLPFRAPSYLACLVTLALLATGIQAHAQDISSVARGSLDVSWTLREQQVRSFLPKRRFDSTRNALPRGGPNQVALARRSFPKRLSPLPSEPG